MSTAGSDVENNNPFTYDKRKLASGYIRLLKFEPRNASEKRLSLTLYTPALPSADPNSEDIPVRYLALSYVWGKPGKCDNEDPGVWANLKRCLIDFGQLVLSYVWGKRIGVRIPEILINGRPFKVWPYLHKALVHLEDQVDLPIWIDAICINQQDVDEKTEQVKQMTDIYKNAVRTIIWLGEGDRSTSKLMAHLDRIGKDAIDAGLNDLTTKDLERWPNFGSDVDDEDDAKAKAKVEIKDKLEALFSRMTKGYEGQVPFPLQGLINLTHNNHWFTRVWVIQELCVSVNYTFMCGKSTVQGDHFTAGFQFCSLWMNNEFRSITQVLGGSVFLLASRLISRWWRNRWRNGWALMNVFWRAVRNKPSGLNARASATLGTRRKWQRDCPQDLPTLKAQLCHAFIQGSAGGLNATDPRDRIFAFLGIASDAKELGIVPDYSKTKEMVYNEVARKLVHHGHLDILTLCRASNSGSQDGSLASYAPDWEKRILPPWGGFIEDDLFHASGRDQPRFPPFSEPLEGVLTVKARFVGKLSEVGTTWNSPRNKGFDHDEARLFFTEVIDFLGKSTIFKEPEETEKVFWRIPIGDKEMNDLGITQRATEKSFVECQDMMAVLTHKQNPWKLPNMMSYLSSMKDMHNAKPFLSEGGYVGLCPDASEPEDEIFIPFGSHVPLIFRQDDDDHRVVGEAYVQGLMDGEALDLDLQIRDVRLI